MFLNSFLSGFFYPLICYAHNEKVHPLRNALFRYGVAFDNNVPNLVTLGGEPDPNIYYRTFIIEPIYRTKKKDTHQRVFLIWRCRPDLNWGVRVLQTLALPLGHGTI